MVYPSWPHVLITKLVQLLHNCAFPTVKEKKRDIWGSIRAVTYDLYQLIHNVKSKATQKLLHYLLSVSMTQ